MTVIRRGARPADQFVMVSNGFARDRRLSLAARGLGLWLLSHEDGWQITASKLASEEGVGRDKLRAYLRELEDAGYLLRDRERIHGGRLGGMLYEMHCTPQEPTTPRSDQRLTTQALVDQAPVSGQHKKTTSKKTIPTKKKTNPSGGQTAHAAAPNLEDPSTSQEEPMAPSAPSPGLDQFELFADIQPEPPKAKDAGKPKSPASPSAGSVVASFVDAYRKAHSGQDPVKSAIGRVARDAKMLIESGRAAATELERAAAEMGGTSYNNLPVSLDKLREKPLRRQAGVPARPHTDDHWRAVEEREKLKWYNDLVSDDDAVRWARRDPSEVDRLIAEYPELADRFRDVA